MKQSLRWLTAQKLEKFWWNNYLSGKKTESYLDWKKNYWDNILNTVFEINHNTALTHENFNSHPLEILDAGSGPAGIFLNLQHHRVVAIDPLMEYYLQEIKLFNPSDFSHVQFQQKSLEQLNVIEKFDIIFCMNAINHVQEISTSLHNLFSALKKGGLMVLSVDAHRFSLPKSILKLLPLDILHPHQYSAEDYLELIKKNCTLSEPKIKVIKTGNLFNHLLIVANKV